MTTRIEKRSKETRKRPDRTISGDNKLEAEKDQIWASVLGPASRSLNMMESMRGRLYYPDHHALGTGDQGNKEIMYRIRVDSPFILSSQFCVNMKSDFWQSMIATTLIPNLLEILQCTTSRHLSINLGSSSHNNPSRGVPVLLFALEQVQSKPTIYIQAATISSYSCTPCIHFQTEVPRLELGGTIRQLIGVTAIWRCGDARRVLVKAVEYTRWATAARCQHT